MPRLQEELERVKDKLARAEAQADRVPELDAKIEKAKSVGDLSS